MRQKMPQLRSVLSNAEVQAKRSGHERVGTGHLLLGMTLTHTGPVRGLLETYRLNAENVESALLARHQKGLYVLTGTLLRTSYTRQLVHELTEQQARKYEHDVLLQEHLLLAMLEPLGTSTVDSVDCALAIMSPYVAPDVLREATEASLVHSYEAYEQTKQAHLSHV